MDARHGTLPDGFGPHHLQPNADSPVARALRDIAFGSLAGMVSEVFEYPFDLAKTRLQSQVLENTARFSGPLDCLKQTWKNEGVRGLYRGLPVPLVGSMAETASVFVAYTQLQRLIRSASPRGATEDLTIAEHGLAAGGAGFLTSFILTPIELVKCRLQVQMLSPSFITPNALLYPQPVPARSQSRAFSTSWLPRRATLASRAVLSPSTSNPLHTTSNPALFPSPNQPPGPLKIISNIVRNHGLGGLWLGHTGTIFRETGGTAVWFASKELFASMLLARRPPSPSLSTAHSGQPHLADDLAPWESALAGAASGALCVLTLYPADTVKSAIQTRDELRPAVGARHVQPAFWATARAMWRSHGLRGLYAGCGMTVARAVPGSGIVFVIYDGLTQHFG
ncbi:mitochondrial carrier [Athelia psychrophila]|uniref:Mitochondrial carrier n=1 Tax=Athelia psychrophila TaxID=1759441 RepID=A0A166P2Y0_9AGAM|nr:mitochondrial carrier [Fibularhizoctonia sp. CBS 109695]